MIRCGFTLEEKLVFYGEKRDLLELMGNLLDNAFKYGQRARCACPVARWNPAHPGRVCGCGSKTTAPASRNRIGSGCLQRGSRGDEQAEGHGLGLAIVMELVTAYGGEVSIGHSDLGGAKINVEYPGLLKNSP